MNMKSLQWLSLAAVLAALPVECAFAQQGPPPNYASIVRQGYNLGKVDAEKLEASLASKPDDLEARTRLLGYYWRGARYETPETKIAARRRHILWLIEHRPASEPAGLRQTTINRTGRALVDPEGHDQAAKLWIEQAQRHGTDAKVLGNAAWFFLMYDKARAEALLKQAKHAAPGEAEWSSRLGLVYAMSILGLDSMNENFFPFSHNPADAAGEFARHARQELEKSTDVPMLLTAGLFLAERGLMLDGMSRRTDRPLTVDYGALSDAFLLRAQELDPANQGYSQLLQELRKQRQELESGTKR